MNPSINKIVIYSKNIEKMVRFYENYFDFKRHTEVGDRIVELISPHGGISLMIHPAGKGIKEGQVVIKLVFDVIDVEKFREKCAKKGLKFGAIHKANGYVFSNAKVFLAKIPFQYLVGHLE